MDYAILGEGETCSGDPARRIGNEFVFQIEVQNMVKGGIIVAAVLVQQFRYKSLTQLLGRSSS